VNADHKTWYATGADCLVGRPAADFVRQYRAQLTVEQLMEYFDPKTDYSLDAVAAELEALPPARESA